MGLDLIGGSGLCCQCSGIISSIDDACQALGMLFHTSCFVCSCCSRELKDQVFYKDQGKLYCEDDYLYCGFQQGCERCCICGHMIPNQILRAMNKSYHIECFRCSVCNECLDGLPFTVDVDGKNLCVRDYFALHSNLCYVCNQPFAPISKDDFSVKSVVALGKEFHCDCFVCEECGTSLMNASNDCNVERSTSVVAAAANGAGLFCAKYDVASILHLYCRQCVNLMKYCQPTSSRLSSHRSTGKLSNSSSSSSGTSLNSSHPRIHSYNTR